MRLKRVFLPLLCTSLVGCALVGSGFSYFVFHDSLKTEKWQDVTVKTEDYAELGDLTIVGSTGSTEGGTGGGTGGEKTYGYQLFFGADDLYLFREDNPSQNASFSFTYAPTETIPTGYIVSLACDVTVTDEDERGVKTTRFMNNGGIEETLVYSDSIVDYFRPFSISGGRALSRFTLLSGDENSKSVTYRAVFLEGLHGVGDTQTAAGEHHLNFRYQNYTLAQGQTQSGSLAPSSQYHSPLGFEKNMQAIVDAGNNAKIDIVFRLFLQEEAAR